MRRLLSVLLITVLIGAGLAVLSCTTELPSQGYEFVLSNYPKLFAKDVLIIVGENASQIDQENAQAISAKLKELTGNEPMIESDAALGENDKSNHNLIVVGTPYSNSLLDEIYQITDATRVTTQYPGENKGTLEILTNPWNRDKPLLIVAGSDEWGVIAGGKMLTNDEKIEELTGGVVITEFENGVEPVVLETLNSVMDYIKQTHPDAAAFIKEDMSWTKTSQTITVGSTQHIYTSDGWTVSISHVIAAEVFYDVRAEYNNEAIVWIGTVKDGVITERGYTTK